MAFEITRLPSPGAVPAQVVTAVERLWLTEGRDRVVPDGHPDAAFLFCSPGDEIPVSAAASVGLVEDVEPEPQVTAGGAGEGESTERPRRAKKSG